MMNNIEHILESLLFVAEDPLTVDRMKTILETVEPREIRQALQSLAESYETRGGGFGLYEIAGGWQLRSRPEYNEWIKRMLQPPPQRLTKATLETLAIVAYHQPIIRADIEHIRGVDCGGVLRQLMERKLIRVLGRKEIPGRPLIYATTKHFLELFDLKDLKDLPSPKEIEALTAEKVGVDVPDTDLPDAHQVEDAMQSGSVLIDSYPRGTAGPAGPGNAAQNGGIAGQYHPQRPAPCRASAAAGPRPQVGAPPARIKNGWSKITTRQTKIPADKVKP